MGSSWNSRPSARPHIEDQTTPPAFLARCCAPITRVSATSSRGCSLLECSTRFSAGLASSGR